MAETRRVLGAGIVCAEEMASAEKVGVERVVSVRREQNDSVPSKRVYRAWMRAIIIKILQGPAKNFRLGRRNVWMGWCLSGDGTY